MAANGRRAKPPAVPVDNTQPSTQTIDLDQRVAQYVAIRDRISEMKEELAAKLKPLQEAKALLEAMFLAHLTATNQTAARTESGTAHIVDKLSATIEDPGTFKQFVIDNELWDLVDWRANAPTVAEYAETHEGELPPGIKFNRYRTTGVRRSS